MRKRRKQREAMGIGPADFDKWVAIFQGRERAERTDGDPEWWKYLSNWALDKTICTDVPPLPDADDA
jgi:hypothetical protein